MKRWLLINLGDAMLAYDQQDRITHQLKDAFSAAGNPDDMAAFIRHEADGRLHCEVKIYLSPASSAIVKDLFKTDVNVTECEQPSIDSLSLLAGTKNAQQLLFP